jgi:glucokinase
VFIAGGIAPRMIDLLGGGAFRSAFENKSPHEDWAATVPTSVITDPEPALRGLTVLVTDPGLFVFRFREWTAPVPA